MKRSAAILLLPGLTLSLAIFSAFQTNLPPENFKTKQTGISGKHFPSRTLNTPTQDAIHWMSIEEMEQALKKEKRKVLIVLYTDWCGWCKRLERETLQNPEIAAYINEHYYPVRFNAEQREEQIFKNQKYSFVQAGRRGYNQLAYELTRGKLSYPTCVFLDENEELIQSIPGYKSARDFRPIITFFGEDYYKKMCWETFLKKGE